MMGLEELSGNVHQFVQSSFVLANQHYIVSKKNTGYSDVGKRNSQICGVKLSAKTVNKN